MAPLSIAIIGAGPGGTVLARLLSRSSVPITLTIFEAEQSLDVRTQGGTLDLRPGGGLKAMREAGLWDEFCKHARTSGEALQVVDKTMTTWLRRVGREEGEREPGRWSGGAAPEIDRRDLREILVKSVPDGVIRWGKKVVSVEEEDGEVVVRFQDGEMARGFDLVVGADGAWSKVRKMLSDVAPYYSGIGGHAFEIADAEEKAPEVWKFVDGGSVFGFSDAKDIVAQVMGDGSLHVSTWSVRSEDWMRDANYDIHDLEQARNMEKKEYEGWAPELTRILDVVNGGVAPRCLYMLPVDFAWKHRKGVTLLGDAAHLMTPFAGIGVNMAMQDALELAHAIIAGTEETDKTSNQDVLDEHMKKYETELFPRMHAAQAVTAGSMQEIFFTEGFPRYGIQRWAARIAGHDMHPFLRPFFTAALYTYFFFLRMFI